MVRLIIKVLLVIFFAYANDVMAQKKGTITVTKADSAAINNSKDFQIEKESLFYGVLSSPVYYRISDYSTIFKKNKFNDYDPVWGPGVYIGIGKAVKNRLDVNFTVGIIDWTKVSKDSSFLAPVFDTRVRANTISIPAELKSDFYIYRVKRGRLSSGRDARWQNSGFGITATVGSYLNFTSIKYTDVNGSAVKQMVRENQPGYSFGFLFPTPFFFLSNISLCYGKIGGNNYLSLYINQQIW